VVSTRLSYREGTTRRSKSIEISSTASQLYEQRKRIACHPDQHFLLQPLSFGCLDSFEHFL